MDASKRREVLEERPHDRRSWPLFIIKKLKLNTKAISEVEKVHSTF